MSHWGWWLLEGAKRLRKGSSGIYNYPWDILRSPISLIISSPAGRPFWLTWRPGFLSRNVLGQFMTNCNILKNELSWCPFNPQPVEDIPALSKTLCRDMCFFWSSLVHLCLYTFVRNIFHNGLTGVHTATSKEKWREHFSSQETLRRTQPHVRPTKSGRWVAIGLQTLLVLSKHAQTIYCNYKYLLKLIIYWKCKTVMDATMAQPQAANLDKDAGAHSPKSSCWWTWSCHWAPPPLSSSCQSPPRT